MSITKITFMQTFPTGNFSNQKLGVEIEVDEGNKVTGESNHDYAMDAFKEAKELVNRAFDRMNPGVINGDHAVFTNLATSSPMDVVKVETSLIDEWLKDIESCTIIDQRNNLGVQTGLLAYEELAGENDIIKSAYDRKMEELKK